MVQCFLSNLKILLIFFILYDSKLCSTEFSDLLATYKDIETITPDLVISETVLQNTKKNLVLKIQMKGQKLDRYLFYTKSKDGYRYDGDQVTAYPQAFYVLLYKLQNSWILGKKKRQLLAWMQLSDLKDHQLEALFMEKYHIYEQLASLSGKLNDPLDIHVNSKSVKTGDQETSEARLLQIYLEDLGLRNATWQSSRNCLDLEIGGMNGHRLGYMFCEDDLKFPKISRLGFYYIAHLKPGWFFYRRLLSDPEE